jgi:hypothetical protein
MHNQPRFLGLSALLLATALALPALAASTGGSAAVPTALEMPWEASLGPDTFAWVTAGPNGIDLEPEKKSVALAIDEVFAGKEQEGLLGFAFDAEFGMGKDHDFVYVAYAVNDRRARIVQYYWDAEAGRLGDPLELLPDAPAAGSVAHN